MVNRAPRRPATLRSIGAAAVGLCLLYPALIAAAGLAARPVPSDLAVVLGNAVAPNGQPSPRLRARLDTAARLFRAGTVRRVLVSGGIETSGADEAAVMAAYLVQQGVPATAILQDHRGDDTFETARNTVRLAGSARSVVVVTQWFHIPRAVLAMRRFEFGHVSAAWPRYAEWRDVYSLLREAAALPVYAFRPVAAPAAAARRPPPA